MQLGMAFRCSNLAVEFHDKDKTLVALDGVSFGVSQGEFLALIGPSGCGKTTLLRVIAGALQPSRGSIEFAQPGDSGDGRRLLVYQEDSLFPWMTAVDNAAFGLEMKGVRRAARRQAAAEMLARHGLQGHEESYPCQLSAGMKQRVAVIRAFLTDPGLLLMDEPFGSLDTPTRNALQADLLNLWEKSCKPVVFVTHDVEEALYLSDRVLVFSERPGRVIHEVPVTLPRAGRRAAILSEESMRLKRRIVAGLSKDGASAVMGATHAS